MNRKFNCLMLLKYMIKEYSKTFVSEASGYELRCLATLLSRSKVPLCS